MALGATGCTEYQFALHVHDAGAVTLASSSESVQRDRTPSTAAAGTRAFADRGVLLADGSRFAYERDGEWITSVDSVQFAKDDGRTALDFTIHPGRRDLPLVLETSSANVCSLRLRKRMNRGLGYAGIVVGVMTGAFTPLAAAAKDSSTRAAAPYIGVAGGVLVLGGLALVLWPPSTETVATAGACD